jgi:type II secretory pathway pseudopilin PulG
MGCDDHNSKPVIVVIVIIIAVLLIITTALCAFVVKKQCLRREYEAVGLCQSHQDHETSNIAFFREYTLDFI